MLWHAGCWLLQLGLCTFVPRSSATHVWLEVKRAAVESGGRDTVTAVSARLVCTQSTAQLGSPPVVSVAQIGTIA
jgi:hypothetical protein